MPDVFFYEAFAEEAEQLKRGLDGSFTAEFAWETIQERGDKMPSARIVSIRTQSEIPADWAGRVDAILARATGYDHLVAWRRATRANVPCGYLPLYAARAVAEHALMTWLALGRRLKRQQRQFEDFRRDGLTGSEFAGKRLLVVGVGNIGHEVVRIGRGLGMVVESADIVHRHDDVDYVDAEKALPEADVIVCAMNLTPENENYFDYARLQKARPGAIFVNIARGEQSPASDMLRLLEEGRLGGVGLDVFRDEPALGVALRAAKRNLSAEGEAVMALAERDDAILTPHNAFNTREAVARKAGQSIEQIAHFLTHGRFKWPVP